MATESTRPRDQARRARVLRGARARTSATPAALLRAPTAADHLHGVAGPVGARGCARSSPSCSRRSPTARFEVLETVAEDDRAAVRWRARGTFAGPGSFKGFEPNGARVDLEGVDVVAVRDGRIVAHRRLHRRRRARAPARRAAAAGLGRRAAHGQGLQRAHAAASAASAGDPEPIADGVWVVRGGFPRKTMNVYFVRDGDGVLLFDAGIEAMTGAVAAAGARSAGSRASCSATATPTTAARRRGSARRCYCHPDDRADAEGDGGMHYFDLSKLGRTRGRSSRYLLSMWDGGP